MKFDFAVFTTDGDTTTLPMPVSMERVERVAKGETHFTAVEDYAIARWMIEISKILALK